MSPRVLITCKQMQNVYDVFEREFSERGIEVHLPVISGQQMTEDELIEIIGDFDGIIAGDDPLTDAVLEHATRLRIISKWGVGIDAIDLEAARRRGIPVTNTPGVFGEDVADAALGYLLSLTRHIPRIHESVSAGGWLKIEGTRLSGKTAGVIGFGSIGQAVARRLLAFGCRTLAYDPVPEALATAERLGVEGHRTLTDVLKASEALVLCAPLTPDTHHLLNEDTLALLPPRALVINVSRGPMVQESALVAALESGHVAAAALDVFEEEPMTPDNPLRRFEQCVFGSHNGSNTREGVLDCSAQAVRNVIAGLG